MQYLQKTVYLLDDYFFLHCLYKWLRIEVIRNTSYLMVNGSSIALKRFFPPPRWSIVPRWTPVLCARINSRIPSSNDSLSTIKCKSLWFTIRQSSWVFLLRTQPLVWKNRRNVRIWKSSFAQITGHQLVFLADCKDVVVSCVIVDPIYNHEREGRGNFVQEGKSGELASPPSLPQSSSVGGRLSASRYQQQRQKAPKHLLLSYSPS